MPRFIERYVTHNLGLKIASLLLAVGLWLAIAHDPTAEVAVDVPIEFQHMPANLEISSEKVPQAQIRIRGPERLIHRLIAPDVHAEIDTREVTPGERTFDLTAQQIRLPHDLTVVQVVPSQFQVEFDRLQTRLVAIKPRVKGTFADGYGISQITTDPSSLLIKGPRSRVSAVESAITDPVDVSGTMEHTMFVTHAYVPDPLVQVVHPEPVRVIVTVQKMSPGDPH